MLLAALDPQQFSLQQVLQRNQPCSLSAFPGAPRLIILSSCFCTEPSPALHFLSAVQETFLGTSYIILYISVLVLADLGLVCALQSWFQQQGVQSPGAQKGKELPCGWEGDSRRRQCC